MSHLPPDDRNPLARALEEVSTGPEARAFSIPVEAVRARSLNRRAWRVAGVGALVLALVGGGAGIALASMYRTSPPVAGPTGTATDGPSADRPGQFARCGQPAGDVLPDLGEPMALTLVEPSASVPADRAWTATVQADTLATADPDVRVVVWATDLSVVSNGVVVGVQDGPTAPDLSEPFDERLADRGMPLASFPVSTDVVLALASCDPHPTGEGSPDLGPGTYDLVVTQTISFAHAGDAPEFTDARVSTRTTVTVTAPVHAAATQQPQQPQLARCGLPADEVLPDLGALTLQLDDATAEVPADGTWLGRLTATLPGAPDASGWTWGTDLTLLRDGRVVAVQSLAGAPTDLAAAAATVSMPASPFPLVTYGVSGFSSCDPAGGDVAPGTYDLVVTETVAAEGDDGTRTDARASVRTTVAIGEGQHAVSAAATACGETDDQLRRLADPQQNPAPVTVEATVPAATATGAGSDLEVTVRYTGTDDALISSGTPTVVLTRDGVIVGGAGLGGSGTGPGMWVTLGGNGPFGDCATAAAGTDVRDLTGTTLPPGDYQAWAVTTTHLATPTAHDAQVAGGPWPLTLAAG